MNPEENKEAEVVIPTEEVVITEETVVDAPAEEVVE